MLIMLLLALGLNSPGPIEEIKLSQGVRLEASGRVIDIEVGHLVPVMADWNGDGLPDLFVGQFMDGKITVFVNQGSKGQPVFAEGQAIKAEDEIIKLPFG